MLEVDRFCSEFVFVYVILVVLSSGSCAVGHPLFMRFCLSFSDVTASHQGSESESVSFRSHHSLSE